VESHQVRLAQRRIAVVTAALMVLGITYALGRAPAKAASCGTGLSYTPPSGISSYFNRIDTGTNGVRDQLIQLINAANPQSTIRLAEYKLNDAGVVTALTNAKCRLVNVQIILDDVEVGNSSWTTLVGALGTNTSNGSWIIHCPKYGVDAQGNPITEACLSHLYDTINHNKFATFSNVGLASKVVYQMTMNLKCQ
jgi:hypothetical protein